MLAVSARVLDADGYWLEPNDGMYFLLFDSA